MIHNSANFTGSIVWTIAEFFVWTKEYTPKGLASPNYCPAVSCNYRIQNKLLDSVHYRRGEGVHPITVGGKLLTGCEEALRHGLKKQRTLPCRNQAPNRST